MSQHINITVLAYYDEKGLCLVGEPFELPIPVTVTLLTCLLIPPGLVLSVCFKLTCFTWLTQQTVINQSINQSSKQAIKN